MDLQMIPETGDPQITLQNLRQLLENGLKVKDCVVRGRDIFIAFEDREYHAVGFKIGAPCRPFAEFVVAAELDEKVDKVERYLATLSPDEIQGAICWVGFKDLEPWHPGLDDDHPADT